MNTEEYWAKMEEELERMAEEGPAVKPWQQRENDILRKFYGRVSARNIASMLGRSVTSIYQKADGMGLSKAR